MTLDVTTAANVKTFGTITGTGKDTLIANLITAVSYDFEQFMGRKLLDTGADITEILDFEFDDQRFFGLSAWPVSSVTSVHYDPDGDFEAGDLIAADDYVAPSIETNNDGVLRLRIRLRASPRALKVVYQGGMATSAANFITSYPDIALAADMQVFYYFQRAAHIGTLSVAGSGGSVSLRERMDFLPQVKRTLMRHRRIAV